MHSFGILEVLGREFTLWSFLVEDVYVITYI